MQGTFSSFDHDLHKVCHTLLYGYNEQPVLSQNSINVLESQSYISRVLAGILALQNGDTKDHTVKQIGCCNLSMVTIVADKLKKHW